MPISTQLMVCPNAKCFTSPVGFNGVLQAPMLDIRKEKGRKLRLMKIWCLVRTRFWAAFGLHAAECGERE